MQNGYPGRLRPCNIRVNSAAFYWLNYRGMKKMVEAERIALPMPGCRLGALLLGYASTVSKLARSTGAGPAISCSTGRRLCCLPSTAFENGCRKNWSGGRVERSGTARRRRGAKPRAKRVNCTRFSGVTSRCPADWATHLGGAPRAPMKNEKCRM